jgi:hypothetical protein
MGRFTEFLDDVFQTNSQGDWSGTDNIADGPHTDHESDWSSAWGTAADWQVPAESNFDEPTISYVEDSYWRDDHSFD